jgi:hypothetical protein
MLYWLFVPKITVVLVPVSTKELLLFGFPGQPWPTVIVIVSVLGMLMMLCSKKAPAPPPPPYFAPPPPDEIAIIANLSPAEMGLSVTLVPDVKMY